MHGIYDLILTTNTIQKEIDRNGASPTINFRHYCSDWISARKHKRMHTQFSCLSIEAVQPIHIYNNMYGITPSACNKHDISSFSLRFSFLLFTSHQVFT